MKHNIVIIYGSARESRQGIKAARFIDKELRKRGHNVTLIDALDYPLPFLNKMHKEYTPGTAPKSMESLHEMLNNAEKIANNSPSNIDII